jgi:16S rRNA (guanine966-N2)-methyltransferase
VRVIAGKYRSRRLKGPLTLAIRPTSDRLRETLFNVLGPAVQDSLFLDLYAGTGAVGIEAISRGARLAVFVESNPAAAKLIRQNLELLEVQSFAELNVTDVLKGLDRIAKRRMLADFIFIDPPYAKPAEHLRVLEYLDSTHVLAPSGLVIVENHWRTELPERFERLECTREIEQGDTVLSLFALAAAA